MKGFPSAPTMTVRMKSNLLPALGAALPGLVQARVTQAAEAFRDQLRAALDDGRRGIGNDTGALMESLTVKTPFGSDYDERLKAAAAAYIGNPSKWASLVQTYVTSKAYTPEHFDARVATEEPLAQPSKHEAIAAVSTMLAWGFFWEFGHSNELTGQYEHRPWMGPEADVFEAREFEKHFENLLRDF